MEERKPGWVNGVEARDARLVTGASFQAETAGDVLDPLRVRSGIRFTAGDPGRVSLTGNTIKVNPFQAVLANKTDPGEGPYVVSLGAVKELTLSPPHSTLPRKDLVVAEVIGTEFTVSLYTGESKASPVAPEPAGSAWLGLAEISVPKATEQPVLSDRRRFTAAAGGILPVTRALEAPTSAQAYPGQFSYRLDSGELQVFQGGGWKRFAQPRNQWVPLDLQSKWRIYDSARYHGPEVLVDDQGFARLRGMVRGTDAEDVSAGNPTGMLASVVFVLPPVPTSARPTKETIVPIIANGASHRANIVTTGGFWIPKPTGASSYPTWVSLDGLSFPVL